MIKKIFLRRASSAMLALARLVLLLAPQTAQGGRGVPVRQRHAVQRATTPSR